MQFFNNQDIKRLNQDQHKKGVAEIFHRQVCRFVKGVYQDYRPSKAETMAEFGKKWQIDRMDIVISFNCLAFFIH